MTSHYFMLLMPKAENTNGLVACVFLFTMQAFTLCPIYIQINNKTIIEFGSRIGYEEPLSPPRPHSIIIKYTEQNFVRLLCNFTVCEICFRGVVYNF